MDDVRRNRDMKNLINSLFFYMNQQNLHLHQIAIEEKRFHQSVQYSAPNHKKVQHVRQIRDFQLLLAENARQIQNQHNMLKKFLDINTDLKDTRLYQQAGEVLKETLYSLK